MIASGRRETDVTIMFDIIYEQNYTALWEVKPRITSEGAAISNFLRVNDARRLEGGQGGGGYRGGGDPSRLRFPR